MTLEERITRLEDIEAIRSLQARYQRLLDSRCFDELAECFTEDAVSSYGNNTMAYTGRKNIIHFLMSSMTLDMPSCHLIHGGEIDWKDKEHASGIWYLEDHLHLAKKPVSINGTAIYHVEYRKENGKWLIAAIGYERNFEYYQGQDQLTQQTLLSKTTLLEKVRKAEEKDLGPLAKEFRKMEAQKNQ